MKKHSNQTELDQFFKVVKNQKQADQCITKSAFFQARKQLSHKAFIELNHQLVDDIYKKDEHYQTRKGFRLCAVDGTSIRYRTSERLCAAKHLKHSRKKRPSSL